MVNSNSKFDPDETKNKIKFDFFSRIRETLPFQIKSDTGEIFAKRILNREQKDLYLLSVVATDNGPERLSAVAQLTIRVLPQLTGSLLPHFDQREYTLILPENAEFTKRPAIIQIRANDSDNRVSGSPGRLVYSLAGSLNDLNTFEIESQTGTVRLVSKLNYELKNYYKLSVIARDLGQPPCAAHVSLTINIEDMNQSPPTFTAPFYEFILFENARVGQLVGKVFAYENRQNSIQQSSLNWNNSTRISYSIDGQLQTSGS
jgi:hypothetical protein